jgi:hypothetical protein
LGNGAGERRKARLAFGGFTGRFPLRFFRFDFVAKRYAVEV